MTMPKFNLKADISEEQFKQLEAKASQGGKFFKPGNYDLKIITAALHGNSKGDETWLVYLLELGGIDDRKIKYFLSAPTTSIRYNKPGIKDPLVLTYKLRQFLSSLGEDNSIEVLGSTLKNLFEDPSVLVGRVLNVDIGYTDYYIDRIEDGQFKIFEKSGKEFRPNGQDAMIYPDKDSAIADAANYKVLIDPKKSYPQVLKFNPAPETDDDFSF